MVLGTLEILDDSDELKQRHAWRLLSRVIAPRVAQRLPADLPRSERRQISRFDIDPAGGAMRRSQPWTTINDNLYPPVGASSTSSASPCAQGWGSQRSGH